MFGSLTEKLTKIFSSLSGQKTLSEDNVADAVREVRLALLDADVNYQVVKNFIKRVKDKAVGDAVLKSVTPAQQFVKVVHEELVSLMGSGEAELNLKESFSTLMLVGLQGVGKTTHAAKLAHLLKKKEHKKNPLLIACDLKRPAAIAQLKSLAHDIQVPVFALEGEKDPVKVAKAGVQYAKEKGFNLCILDTAGRLHIDEELMRELKRLQEAVQPQETLFVASATSGQDAVRTATDFSHHLSISGVVLTMLDSEARSGAALSLLEVLGKPIKFEGIGEKIEDLQLFNARSMADRILGMGDTINLVKKVEEHISAEEAKSLEEKVLKATFTFEDYLKQMQAVKKMGSLGKIMKMMPGMDKLGSFDLDASEKEFGKVESIILSMTPKERKTQDDLSLGRIKRIAKGSGTDMADVNKLRKSFQRSKELLKKAPTKKMLERFQKSPEDFKDWTTKR